MQFWPLGVGIIGVALVALFVMVVMIRTSRSGVVSKGPRHRWNKERDLRVGAEHDKAPGDPP